MSPPASTRFRARHDTLALLEIEREVSAAAAAEDPEGVSERSFDLARGRAGHPDCPQARSIAARLGCSWADVLAAAHGDPDDAHRRVRQAASDKGRTFLTEAEIIEALAQAAAFMNVRELSASDYGKAWEEMTGPARRAWLHGGDADLPSQEQILAFIQRRDVTWQSLCEAAGLAARRQPLAKAMPFAEAVRMFADLTGMVPCTAKQVIAFPRAQQFAMSRHTQGALERAVQAVQAGRSEPLPVAPAGMELPVADAPPPGVMPAQRGRRGWTRTEIILGMAKATNLLEAGTPLTGAGLRRIARDNRGQGIPTTAVVNEFRKREDPGATWSGYVREARQLAARLRRGTAA